MPQGDEFEKVFFNKTLCYGVHDPHYRTIYFF